MENKVNMGSKVDVASQIAKMFAHDFKNPISALMANVNYLEAVVDETDTDLRETVRDSGMALNGLLHMINNYLYIAKLEADESMEPAAVNLDAFVNDAIASCSGMFLVEDSPQFSVNDDVPGTMCEWPIVYARLAVENLMTSSYYNTSPSGKVELNVTVTDGSAVFLIKDTGVDIAPDYYENTFDLTFQLEAKTKQDARYSRGFGLYAAKLAAEKLSGSLKVLPRDGDFNCFELRLPLAFDY